MSNKTQLQTNNSALDALITRVNAAKDTAASLPDAGSGSGGEGITTCTVKIINQIINLGHAIYEIGYSSCDSQGNVIAHYYSEMFTQEEIILENVICGSFVAIISHGYSFAGYILSGGISDLNLATNPGKYFSAPTESGAVGIISIEDQD